MTDTTFYYRIDAIEDRSPYTLTLDGSTPESKPRCTIRHCRVVRTTPSGVFVDKGYGEHVFINKRWNKQYAHPTKEEALQSFIARRKRWLRLLKRDLERAERELKFAEQMATVGVVHD